MHYQFVGLLHLLVFLLSEENGDSKKWGSCAHTAVGFSGYCLAGVCAAQLAIEVAYILYILNVYNVVVQ